MIWPAQWLARRYATLYRGVKTEPFSLNQAQGILDDESLEARDVLRHLETRGLLYKSRQPHDLRRKTYRLIGPEHIVNALAISRDAKTVEDKLRDAGGDFQYVMTGPAAAYEYHGYMTPAKTDLLIYENDLGFWYALFKDKGVEVAIDRILPERAGEIVHLHTTLTDETFSRAQEIDGIFYTSREDLVLELIRDPSDRSVLEALAILVRSSEELDWDLLARSDVRQELGFLMELFNRESAHETFPHSVIIRFAEREGVLKPLSTSDQAVDVSESHNLIADRWNLQVNIPPTVIRKAVEDLAS